MQKLKHPPVATRRFLEANMRMMILGSRFANFHASDVIFALGDPGARPCNDFVRPNDLLESFHGLAWGMWPHLGTASQNEFRPS